MPQLDPATRRSIAQTSGALSQRVTDVEAARHGPWIDVAGTHPDSPPFEGDWTGTARFRWLLGGGVEIEMKVAGTAGTTVFTLPEYLWPDIETPWIPAADDLGNFQVYKVQTDGQVIGGVP